MKNQIKIFKVCFCFILLFVNTNAISLNDDLPNKDKQIQQVLTKAIQQYHIPGAVVTYGFKGDPLHTIAVGYSNVTSRQLMAVNSSFITGSITKSFIAAAILEGVEAGKFKLNDNLNYLAKKFNGELELIVNQYPNLGKVTLKELLVHTSGVPEVINTPNFTQAFIKNPKKIWSNQELLSLAMQHPFYFEPGAAGHWSYTNTDYIILGIVLQTTFQEDLSNIFEKLWIKAKLNGVYYAENGQLSSKILNSMAVGYMLSNSSDDLIPAFKGLPQVIIPGEKTSNKFYELNNAYTIPDPSAAGIVTNTQVLAQWYRALFEQNLLTKKSIKMMLDGVPNAKYNHVKYGLGVMTAYMPRYGYLVTHNGLSPGYSVAVFYFYKYNLVLSVATNSSNPYLNTFDVYTGKLVPGLITDILPILVKEDNVSEQSNDG